MNRMIKINNRFERICELGENDIYRKFSEQFDNLFNADEIAKNKEEFESMYINDRDFEFQIKNFKGSVIHMAKFCVGYTGIGKTTSIRYCFCLGVSNEAIINTERKELVFPTFLDGYQLKDIQKFNLSIRIAAVCTQLEEIYPDLRELMKTDSGKEEFYNFVRNHTSFVLEQINPVDAMDMDDHQLIIEKLKYAYKESSYEFQANRLKFFIKKKYHDIKRLIIILDDIESLPDDYQNKIILEYLKFHKCMQNTDYPENKEYTVNLLMSVRPHTHRILNNNSQVKAFAVSEPAIMKKDVVDLKVFFKKRFDYYTKRSQREIGNIDTWKDCYNELMYLNNIFSGQYMSMIQSLCFLNIRESLAVYSRIFANRFWIQKNRFRETYFTVSSPEYSFNNINVIRALACNEERVFWGDENSIIPNIFLTTKKEDLSVCCLLVLQYFYNRGGYDEYGINASTLKVVKNEWEKIFELEVVKKLMRALEFLYEQKVLRKSIKDFDDINTLDMKESLNDESKLYISPRGNELYNMLSKDSVLLEMLRESSWRDYEGRNYSELASSELLQESKQIDIFKDLFEYIKYLGEQEKCIIVSIKSEKKESYRKVFGNMLVTRILLIGVKKSLDYSGIIHLEDMYEKYQMLNGEIHEVNMLL